MRLRFGLYYIYFFLITLFKAFEFNSSSQFYLVIFAFGCAVVLLKVCTERFKIRELIAMTIIIGIGLLNWLIGGFSPVLTTAVALCGLKNVDVHKLIKMSFWIRLFAFITMILLSVTGIIENEVVDFYRNGEIIQRYLFGYGHPNTTHMAFVVLVLLGVDLYGTKMNMFHYGLVLLCNQLLFSYTGSRTSMLILWIALLCHAALSVRWGRRVFLGASKYLYVLLFLLTLFLGFQYGKSTLISAIDTLVTGRLYYINMILTEEIPSLFGHEEFTTIIVDNGYMELLYNCGILAFVWFSYYIIKMTNKLVREQRYRELLLVTCFVIINMAESSFEIISVNVSLLFIGEIIFESRSGAKCNGANSFYPNLQPGKGTQKSV